MNNYEWRNELNVRIVTFNEHHKRIFALLQVAEEHDRRDDPDPTQLERSLADLIEFIISHFHEEEKVLAENGYALFHEHKEEHDTMLVRTTEHLESFSGGQKEAARWLIDFVAEWFADHIERCDKKYTQLLISAGMAVTPATEVVTSESPQSERKSRNVSPTAMEPIVATPHALPPCDHGVGSPAGGDSPAGGSVPLPGFRSTFGGLMLLVLLFGWFGYTSSQKIGQEAKRLLITLLDETPSSSRSTTPTSPPSPAAQTIVPPQTFSFPPLEEPPASYGPDTIGAVGQMLWGAIANLSFTSSDASAGEKRFAKGKELFLKEWSLARKDGLMGGADPEEIEALFGRLVAKGKMVMRIGANKKELLRKTENASEQLMESLLTANYPPEVISAAYGAARAVFNFARSESSRNKYTYRRHTPTLINNLPETGALGAQRESFLANANLLVSATESAYRERLDFHEMGRLLIDRLEDIQRRTNRDALKERAAQQRRYNEGRKKGLAAFATLAAAVSTHPVVSPPPVVGSNGSREKIFPLFVTRLDAITSGMRTNFIMVTLLLMLLTLILGLLLARKITDAMAPSPTIEAKVMESEEFITSGQTSRDDGEGMSEPPPPDEEPTNAITIRPEQGVASLREEVETLVATARELNAAADRRHRLVGRTAEESGRSLERLRHLAEMIESAHQSVTDLTAETPAHSDGAIEKTIMELTATLDEVAHHHRQSVEAGQQRIASESEAEAALSALGDASRAIDDTLTNLGLLADRAKSLALNATIGATSHSAGPQEWSNLADALNDFSRDSRRIEKTTRPKIDTLQATVARTSDVLRESAEHLSGMERFLDALAERAERQSHSVGSLAESLGQNATTAEDRERRVAALSDILRDARTATDELSRELTLNIDTATEDLQESATLTLMAEKIVTGLGQFRDTEKE